MSVTGILIVIALMLALQIDRIAENFNPNQISSDTDPVDSKNSDLELLEGKVSNLKEQLEMMHGAARKTESEAELKMEIARLEDRILGNSAQTQAGELLPQSTEEIAGLKTKAAEILRLREEIRQCEEAITQSSASAGQVSRELVELEQKVKEMEAAVVAARIQNKSLRLIREFSDTSKEPVIVDVGKDALKIMRFDQPQKITVNSLNEFYTQIRKFRKQDQYFVLYFRPSGAPRFKGLREAVKNSGFEVGYDAIDEDAELALGKGGAK